MTQKLATQWALPQRADADINDHWPDIFIVTCVFDDALNNPLSYYILF